MDATLASIGGAVIAGAISVIGNTIVTAWRAGKTEGIIETTMGALSDRVTKVEEEQEEQKNQWSKIGEHTEAIGYLRGKATGKAHGHPSGL